MDSDDKPMQEVDEEEQQEEEEEEEEEKVEEGEGEEEEGAEEGEGEEDEEEEQGEEAADEGGQDQDHPEAAAAAVAGGGEEGVPKKQSSPPPTTAGTHHHRAEGGSPGKIFVGGLAKDTTRETFVKHFMEYGEITDSVIMRHQKTGQPRGFGFITYADPSVVDKVIQDMHVISGKQVEIKRTIPKGAIPGAKDFKTKKIFVGGIPTSANEDELKSFFAKFGDVKEHQIMRDHASNRSRGFGFITFDTEQAVDDLLAKGNKIDFAGTQVEIKKAEPKKSSNPPSLPSKNFTSRRPAFGGGVGDAYGGFRGEGYGAGPYRSGGGFDGRPGAYSGYGGSEIGGGYERYGPYGSSSLGPYQGESALGSSGRYVGGGYGRAYDLGGYGAGEGYRSYGGRGLGGYGSGYDSALGSSYGGSGGGYGSGSGYGSSGGGMYGTRGGYGGSSGSRYHPYAR